MIETIFWCSSILSVFLMTLSLYYSNKALRTLRKASDCIVQVDRDCAAEAAIGTRPKTRLVGIVRVSCFDCANLSVLNTDGSGANILNECLIPYHGKKVRVTIEEEP